MRLLRQPRLALLFGGTALNEVGSWTSLFALWAAAAFRYHAGAGGVAAIGLAWTLPGALLSIVSGWPIDRFGPKRMLLATNALGAATATAMALAGSYGWLVSLAALSGVERALAEPAAASLPPRLVGDEDLLAANSVLGMCTQLAIILGPLVGSVSVSAWGIRAAFLLDAATFVLGGLALLPLRLRAHPEAAPPAASLTELLEGARTAWQTVPVRRALGLAVVVFGSWGAFLVMEPIYVRDVLHRSPATLGYLQTVFGIGLLGMTALLPRLGDRVATVGMLSWAALASGLAAALYVGTSEPAVAFTGIFIWGVVTGFFYPPLRTLLQRSTPPSTHGRVMAVAAAANGVSGVVAIPVTGAVVGATGVALAGAVTGALLVAAGAVGLAVSARPRGGPQPALGAGSLAPSSPSRAAATAGQADSSAVVSSGVSTSAR